jgi:hypothetical protein
MAIARGKVPLAVLAHTGITILPPVEVLGIKEYRP